MILVSLDDFYRKAAAAVRLDRESEIQCAKAMAQGDENARVRLVESYLPVAAARVKAAPEEYRGLAMAVYCLQALEQAVDSFDFLQDSETFAHRLSWYLRQAVTRYVADSRDDERRFGKGGGL